MKEQNIASEETSLDRLTIRLEEMEMRKADLARAIDETDQTVHQWYKRGRVPDAQLFKIAEVLRCSAEWLKSGKFPGNIKLKDRVMNLSLEAIELAELYDQTSKKGRWFLDRAADTIKRDPDSYRDD